MRWLPTRAWENGIYAVFSNPIGLDDDTIKPGLAMILDPFGEVLVESRALGDDVVVALLTPEKLEQSSGRRYLRARRPELYGKLVEPPPPGPGTHHFTRVGPGESEGPGRPRGSILKSRHESASPMIPLAHGGRFGLEYLATSWFHAPSLADRSGTEGESSIDRRSAASFPTL